MQKQWKMYIDIIFSQGYIYSLCWSFCIT